MREARAGIGGSYFNHEVGIGIEGTGYRLDVGLEDDAMGLVAGVIDIVAQQQLKGIAGIGTNVAHIARTSRIWHYQALRALALAVEVHATRKEGLILLTTTLSNGLERLKAWLALLQLFAPATSLARFLFLRHGQFFPQAPKDY